MKEKAEDLIEFYMDYPLRTKWIQECAIRCVDEILKIKHTDYWLEVKKEIEKYSFYE